MGKSILCEQEHHKSLTIIVTDSLTCSFIRSDLDHQLTVNVVGVHNVICAFLPLLQMGRAKKKKKNCQPVSSARLHAFSKKV